MPRDDHTIQTDLEKIDADEPQFIDPLDEPEPTRDALFSYVTGSITDAAWQAMRDSMPVDANGNPKPDTNNYYVPASVSGTFLNAEINHEVPTMTGGRLYANISSDSFDKHSQVRPRVPQHFLSNWYLKPEVLYRIDLDIDLVDNPAVNWSTLPNGIEWGIPLQIWGQYSTAWLNGQHPVNPPFALSLDRANHPELRFEVQLYGTANQLSTKWEYDNLTTTPVLEFGGLGVHNVQVWWKKDHTGNKSYCKVTIDGETIVERTNVKLGTPFNAQGSVPVFKQDATGGIPQCGIYTPEVFAAPGVEVYVDKFDIFRLAS
jgi:hypothetical protein